LSKVLEVTNKVRIEFLQDNPLRIADIAVGEFFVPDTTVNIDTGSGNVFLVLSAGELMQRVRNRNSGLMEVVDVAKGQATHNFPGDVAVRRVRVIIKAEFV
jgi:hypothetical protein